MTAGDRVKEIRTTKGLTLEKFGSRLGVSKAAISKIERGEASLTDQMCKLMCYEFNISEEWLKTGHGNKYLEKNTNEYIKKEVDKLNTGDDLKRRLITSILSLDNEKLGEYLDWIKTTFDLVDRTAADNVIDTIAIDSDVLDTDSCDFLPTPIVNQSSKDKPFDEMTIEEKVEEYRNQLLEKEAAKKKGVTGTA